MMKTGHHAPHSCKTLLVPMRRCNGGKTNKSHKAWEKPLIMKKSDIMLGANPNPPRGTDVNQNTGATAVNANPKRPA